jgi:hypothetical protein
VRVLIACEFSGRVRDSFRALGHDAWSCDIIPTEVPGPHIINDVRNVLDWHWDMVIAFPPCDHLAASGARWWPAKRADGRQQAAIDFFMQFARLGVPYAIENPVGLMSTVWRKPDQIVQPWWFGLGEQKATCLWLNGLPRLKPTHIVEGRHQRVWLCPPGPNRKRERSITPLGLALAMAQQWGGETRQIQLPLKEAA